MFLKTLYIIVVITATAAALLVLRQQRFETMYEMTRLHSQVAQHRQDVWEMQTRIATQLKPDALVKKVQQSGLAMEPITPGIDGPHVVVAEVEQQEENTTSQSVNQTPQRTARATPE